MLVPVMTMTMCAVIRSIDKQKLLCSAPGSEKQRSLVRQSDVNELADSLCGWCLRTCPTWWRTVRPVAIVRPGAISSGSCSRCASRWPMSTRWSCVGCHSYWYRQSNFCRGGSELYSQSPSASSTYQSDCLWSSASRALASWRIDASRSQNSGSSDPSSGSNWEAAFGRLFRVPAA